MEKSMQNMDTAPAFCVHKGTCFVTGDFGGELIMPDYYPEIRRIVTVRASVLPDSKYIHDRELETGGTLCFSVLYIGEDQTLASIPYITEYSQSAELPTEDLSADCIIIESTAENVSARPLGPRKISLKARVKSRIVYDRYEPYHPPVTGTDHSPLDAARRRSIEKLEKKINTSEKRLYSITGTAEGELKAEGIMKPVMCYGDVLINEISTDNRFLTVKGEAALSTLIQSSDGSYKTLCHSIPFEERMDGEFIKKNTKASVYGRLASASAALDDDGKKLIFEVEYDIDAIAVNELPITYMEDLYSREYETEDIRREIKNQSHLCSMNTNTHISCEGRRKGNVTENDFIVTCIANACVDRVDPSKGKITVYGTCNFSSYVASNGEITAEELSAPFSHEISMPEDSLPSELSYHAKVGASGCTCTIQDHKIKADCSISISLTAFSLDTVSPVWEATVGNKTKGDNDSFVVRVCYPEKGRLLWDIAKEYKASASLCEKLNKKSRTDICDGEPIIIK